VGVDAADAGDGVAESVGLQGFGGVVFVHPGAVGVAEVVEVHAGLDRWPPAAGVAGEGGKPDPAAEVGAAVQPPVDSGEHEPAAARVAALLAAELVEKIDVERR